MITIADGERNVLIVVCAISAGTHAALTPEHFADGRGAGLGFLSATVLLAALAVALTRRPSPTALRGSAVVLVGLLVSYVLATTTGLHSSIQTSSRSTASPSPPRPSRSSAYSQRCTSSCAAARPSLRPTSYRREH